jgi:hypothetical protein
VSSPAHVATPDASAPKEHVTALAIREKPEPRRRMDLPLRTMAQTSGVAKKGPAKDAPSRLAALPERLKHSLAAAVVRSGDNNSNALISEANQRLTPRSGTVAPRPTRRGMPVRELQYHPSSAAAARTRLQRTEEATSGSSAAQQREVNIDRTGLLLLQIHRHTPQDAHADAEGEANKQPVTEGISCAEYQEHNIRKYGERNSRAADEWEQHSCGGCRELIARVSYECVWVSEWFNLCEDCFTKQHWTYTRPHKAGSGDVGGEMDEGE